MNTAPPPQAKPDIHPVSHDASQPRPLGIYLHDLSDSTGTNATLATQAPDFTSAYVALIQHAGAQIGNRPDWGATQQGNNNNHVYEVSTWDREIVMRYSIELLREDPLQQNEPDGPALHQPREHYGMFVEMRDRNETFYVSGAETLGEACHAMKTSAAAYMAQHAGVKLLEKSVELLDERGAVRQRYEVVKGRKINGRFVREDAWLNGHGEGEVPGVARERDTEGPDGAAKTPGLPAAPPPTKIGRTRAQLKSAPRLALESGHGMPPPRRLGHNLEAGIAHPSTPNLASDLLQAAPAPQVQPPTVDLWCTCRAPDDGRLLVACDNDMCPTVWYHPPCLGLIQVPEGDWLCPTCAPRQGGRGRGRPKGKAAPKGKKKKKTG